MTHQGMQLGEFTDAHADVVVLLGGLSMPKSGFLVKKQKNYQ